LDQPLGTITCFGGGAIVQPEFLMKYHGNGENLLSIDGPSSTLTTKDRIGLINVVWLDKQYQSDANHQSVDRPAGTLMTNDKHCMVNAFMFNHNYNNSGHTLDQPSPTLLASRKHFYLLNPQYASKGNDLERPCFTLIARMDKMPPYLMNATEGAGAIIINTEDSETMKKIKLFMAAKGIIDIKMRMLKVNELLRIQGFGDQYILKGTQTDQKRFIGNAVEVNLAMKKCAERISTLKSIKKLKVA
jgi:DNA (cytosine-5)-methyltransferase 1